LKKIFLSVSLIISFIGISLIYNKILFPIYLSQVPKSVDYIKKYMKNEWTSQKYTTKNGYYNYTYKFRDLNNKTYVWDWKASKVQSDKMINAYGIPSSFTKPYVPTPEVIEKRKNQLYKGYFKEENRILGPDHARIIDESRSLVSEIADLVLDQVDQEKLSDRETIELIMSFCQDIPYGIPPDKMKGKGTGGMFPPPLTFNKAWSDCDSKAMLFGSIYLSLPNTKMVLISSPGHMSVGIKGVPSPYDQKVDYKGEKYIFSEPVGSAKYPLGKAASPYIIVQDITPIELSKIKSKSKRSKRPKSVSSSISNDIKLSLREGNKNMNDLIKLYFNHKGQEKNYFELNARPGEGFIKHSTEEKNIFLMVNQPGYYHEGQYSLKKKTYLNLDFSKGKCIYIKTRANKKVYLFQLKNGKYIGNQFQADEGGIIRVIMASGEYIATTDKKITGKTKRFNRESKKGIIFKL